MVEEPAASRGASGGTGAVEPLAWFDKLTTNGNVGVIEKGRT
jgi:hypothetical protein